MSASFKEFNFGVPWEDLYGYSQAVQAGDTLYISGQVSHDETGAFIGSGDFERQVQTTFDNLDRVLQFFGASRGQIVETTVLVRNLRENFDTMARMHSAYCGDHRPTSTVMGVVDLALPDQLVEIGAVVRLDVQR
ncbi:RidA family protein [Streptomyces fructofermentans]|uniref:RidA family protein n=1 Tax=Streptomyces fructofermentans TaxID=152141 RepID=A0A918U5M2_9ACTN|nr:RidA family protein [Streptomyces fructofermentans]GGX95529.1 hypothetical protein GCM10010515_72740 [Streptomyces fructofermentans]